jgi:hypothetical protein
VHACYNGCALDDNKQMALEKEILMNKSTLFYGGIVLAIVFLAIAVYYVIPGIYHPFTLSPPLEWHPTHAVAFLALSAVCVILALVNRRRAVK